MKNKYKLWISATGIAPITFALISCVNKTQEISSEKLIEKTLSKVNVADLLFHENVSKNIEFENGKKEIIVEGNKVEITNVIQEKDSVFVLFEITTKDGSQRVGHRFAKNDFLESDNKPQEQPQEESKEQESSAEIEINSELEEEKVDQEESEMEIAPEIELEIEENELENSPIIDGTPPVFSGEVEAKYKKLDNHRRVGHWNILNYPGSVQKPKNHIFKVDAIATTIWKTRQDIVGLTEINFGYGKKVKDIQDKLNEKWGKNTYSLLLQPTSDKNPNESNQTAEQIAILYNHYYYEVLKTMSFGHTNNLYKRPLFGALFKDKATGKTIITIFGHFDSPGRKRSNNQYVEEKAPSPWTDQGEREVNEALALPKVFEEFQKLDPSASIIFEGDTNIKTRNNKLFLTEGFLNAEIKNYYGDMNIHEDKTYKPNSKTGDPLVKDIPWVYEYYDTSAGQEHKENSKKDSNDLYANAYDKILFREKSGLNIISEKEKIDIKTESYNDVWFKFDLINSYETDFYSQYLKDFWKETEKYKESKTQALKHRFQQSISDHTIVWVDYELNS